MNTNTLLQTQNNYQTLSTQLFFKENEKFMADVVSTEAEQETLTTIVNTVEKRVKVTVKKTVSNNKWTTEETSMFLRLMRVYSTDFQTIRFLLETKNRSQVKRKFKLLQRTHEKLLNEILNGSTRYVDEEILTKASEMMSQN